MYLDGRQQQRGLAGMCYPVNNPHQRLSVYMTVYADVRQWYVNQETQLPTRLYWITQKYLAKNQVKMQLKRT